MRLSEITFNTTSKSATTRYDFDEFINNAEFTGKVIGNYELWIGRYGTGEALLLKSDDEIDPGFLGAMYLLKSGDEKYYHTEIMFDPEIQGKGLAVPMYLYVLQDMGLTIMSDRTQTPGGAAIWKKLAEMPGVNVYIYNTTDNSFHGEYDPKDSGRVYGPEDWRHKIRLVATTDTVTSVEEAWSAKYKKSIDCSNPKGFSQKAHCAGRKKKTNESVDIPEPDDSFFKENRFKRTEYAGMKLVYGEAYQLFQIYAYSMHDQAIGAVMFRYDPEYDAYIADDLYVESRFRRQGVATAMYDFAKSQLDAPVKPSTAQTPDGAAFWGKKEVWESATPDDIFYMISDIHTGHNDIETDEEFQQWVGSFDKYELEDIPLSKLKVSQSNINADKAKSYIKQKNAPPIVVDGTNYWIIDGHHRVAAALARGDKTIKGYVGINELDENFHDGKKKGKSRPGRVKKAGASCQGSVSHLRQMAKKYSGERGRMYHWCANMKGGKKKKK